MGAPLAPVPGVLKVLLSGFVDTSAADTKWENLIHFTYGGTPPSNAQCAALAQAIGTAWTNNIASLCPSPTTLQLVEVTDLTSASAGQGESLPLSPGTRGDDSIPANAAFLISYPSAVRYKGGHPRNYLYVLGNADLSGATNWSTAATTEVQTHWRAFLSACLGIGSVGGVTLSGFCSIRYRGKFLPNGGPPHYYLTTPVVNPIPIASATGVQKMASQRGRIGRRSA